MNMPIIEKNLKIFNKIDEFNEIINYLVKFKSYLILSMKNYEIKILNKLENRQYILIKTLKIHKNKIISMLLYNNSIITASLDKSIKIVNLYTQSILKELYIHKEPLVSIIIHKNYLISGSIYSIKITNLNKKYELIKELFIKNSIYLQIYNNQLVIILKNFILINNINKKFNQIKKISYNKQDISNICIHDNILFFGVRNIIEIFDWQKFIFIKNLAIHNGKITVLSIYQDLLFSGSIDKKIIITDILNNFLLINVINLDYNYIYLNIFGKYMIYNNILYKFYLDNNFNFKKKFYYTNNYITSIICDYNNLYCGNSEGTIFVYDRSMNFKLKFKLEYHHKSLISDLVIYNNFLISGSHDTNIIFADIFLELKISKELQIHDNFISSLVIYNDYLISGSYDKLIKITYIPANLQLLYTLNYHDSLINQLLIYKNYLISSSFDTTIKISDISSNNKVVKVLKLNNLYSNTMCIYKDYLIFNIENEINIIDFNSNFNIVINKKLNKNKIIYLTVYNNYLISSYTDNNIIISDIEDNFKIIKNIMLHDKSVLLLMIHDDYLYSSSFDNSFNILKITNYTKNIDVNRILYFYYSIISTEACIKINTLKPIFTLIDKYDTFEKNILSNFYFKINFHIIKYSENYKLWIESLNYFGFDYVFYNNDNDDNIFNIIINNNKLQIFLPHILNYFNKNNINNQISYNTFLKILKNWHKNDELYNSLLDYVLNYSLLDKNLSFIKLININNYFICKSNSIYLKEHIFNKKIKNIKSKTKKKYIIKNFSFKIPVKLSYNKELFNILEYSTDIVKLSDIKYIINYFFDKIYIFKFFNWILFLLMIIFLFLFINLKNKNILYLYLVNIIYFAIYEVIQFIINFKYYYKNFINYFDILLITYNLIIFFYLLRNLNIKINEVIMILFYINGFKLLILLKSIDFIRKQIRLFIKVLVKTIQFMIFIFIILVYLSLINFLFNYESLTNIYLSMFTVYGQMLGTFDDNYENLKLNQYFEILINTYIFNIILLNLFISIVGDIFNDYNENQELYDIQERIFILKEYSSIYVIIEKLIKVKDRLFTKRNNLKKIHKNKFFFIVKPKIKENMNDFENLKSELNLEINALKYEIKNIKKDLKNSIDLKIINLKDEFKLQFENQNKLLNEILIKIK